MASSPASTVTITAVVIGLHATTGASTQRTSTASRNRYRFIAR